MSVDFEALIKSAMKDGSSADDLAAQFTTAMNNIANKRKEVEKLEARNKWLTTSRADALDSFNNTSGCYEDIAALLTVLIGFSEEGRGWSLNKLQDFYDCVASFLPKMVKSYNDICTVETRAKKSLEDLKERAAARSDRIKEKVDTSTLDYKRDLESVRKFLDELFK